MLNFHITVEDAGELKTVTRQDIKVLDGEGVFLVQFDDLLNQILDRRSAFEAEVLGQDYRGIDVDETFGDIDETEVIPVVMPGASDPAEVPVVDPGAPVEPPAEPPVEPPAEPPAELEE